MNIWSILNRATRLFPNKIGVVDGDVRLTYSELERRIGALANFFRSQGVHSGDRISILDVNSLPYYEVYYAAAGLGAVLNPLNYRLSSRELTYILKDAGLRWLIASSQFASQIEEIHNIHLEGILWIGDVPAFGANIRCFSYEEALECDSKFCPEAVDSDKIAHLYYTSGTTGRPKGVILTHRNVCQHALGAAAEFCLSDADIWGHIAPMFHLADAWAVFAVTLVGGRHVMSPRFDAEAALNMIQEEKITISNLIPTMLNLMVKCPNVAEYDLSSLRMILSGGAPIAPEVVAKIIDIFGCEYVQTYGMTETSPYLTLSLLKEHLKNLPPDKQLAYKSRTGRPFITVDLKVARDDGSEVEPDDNEMGEIWVRGETVTPGYWNSPEETREAFSDGWLRTGDLAVVDREGYVNIVDRRKDMIICGGENIYSIEVENILYEHPKVLEAAVFGVYDEIWGEVVRAAVVLRPGEELDAGELIDFCKTRLAVFKAPESIVFLDELPKTGSGKIHKKTLKERYGKGTIK